MAKKQSTHGLFSHYNDLKAEVKNEIMPKIGTFRYEHFTYEKCLKRLSYLNVKLLQVQEKQDHIINQLKYVI